MRLYQSICVSLMLGLVLGGCQSAASTQSYPSDPLFVSKKPIEAVPSVAPIQMTRFNEPQIPPVPDDVLAASAHRLSPEPDRRARQVVASATTRLSP